MAIRIVLSFFVLGGLWAQTQADWKELVKQGAELLERGRTQQAVESLQKAVHLAPNEIQPHLYLGRAFMKMCEFIPGFSKPENPGAAKSAEKEFLRVLELDHRNANAMRFIAQLKSWDAQGRPDEVGKQRAIDEARGWYQKVLAIQPGDKEAHSTLGSLAMLAFDSEWHAARVRLKMKPESGGLLPDAAVRATLRTRFGKILDDGISHLQRALEIDPHDTTAMATLNMLLRESASLSDTPEECRRLEAEADQWMQKALSTHRQETGKSRTASEPLPPGSSTPPAPPQRIDVPMNTQKAKLIHQPAPIYSALARQAGIQGTVRLAVIIDRDGVVQKISLVSGPPLLVDGAMKAVRQWRYQPTLLDGQPVEVSTQVDVNFTQP
jgi:TonB family protein